MKSIAVLLGLCVSSVLYGCASKSAIEPIPIGTRVADAPTRTSSSLQMGPITYFGSMAGGIPHGNGTCSYWSGSTKVTTNCTFERGALKTQKLLEFLALETKSSAEAAASSVMQSEKRDAAAYRDKLTQERRDAAQRSAGWAEVFRGATQILVDEANVKRQQQEALNAMARSAVVSQPSRSAQSSTALQGGRPSVSATSESTSHDGPQQSGVSTGLRFSSDTAASATRVPLGKSLESHAESSGGGGSRGSATSLGGQGGSSTSSDGSRASASTPGRRKVDLYLVVEPTNAAPTKESNSGVASPRPNSTANQRPATPPAPRSDQSSGSKETGKVTRQ